jgi:hypothetical protein
MTTLVQLLHTGICAGNVGGEYDYWLLKGNKCCRLGVFQVTLFCPGPRQIVLNMFILCTMHYGRFSQSFSNVARQDCKCQYSSLQILSDRIILSFSMKVLFGLTQR